MKRTVIKNNISSGILSARPPKDVVLSICKIDLLNQTKEETETKTNLILKSKKILKVYIDKENNTKLIDIEAVEELGLVRTRVRRVLINRELKYEITDGIIEKIKSNKGPVEIEIEYVELPPLDKQTCKVYYYDNYKFIDASTAYALGFIDAKTFHNSNERYEISSQQYDIIKNKFKVEFINTRLVEEEKKRRFNCLEFQHSNKVKVWVFFNKILRSYGD